MGVILFFGLLLQLGPAVAGSSVVISEIFASPADHQKDAEFVEIYNHTQTKIDLSDWQLTGGVHYVFPRGASIGPGAYAVVALSPTALLQTFQVVPIERCFGPWTGRLSGDGEKLRILNAQANEVDEVEFGNGFPWPVAGGRRGQQELLFKEPDAAGRAASLELIHPDADNREGGAWRESNAALGATPGAMNDSSVETVLPIVAAVAHTPKVPASGTPVQVTASIISEDYRNVRATLRYQIVAPGEFIPAWNAQQIDGSHGYGRRRFYDGTLRPIKNPVFEEDEAWVTVLMEESSPGEFIGRIPGQLHRTLLRYRIFVEAENGDIVRAPQMGDPSLNFACYVSDGVPDYTAPVSPGGGKIHASSKLTKLPVYALLTRKQDIQACMGYRPQQRLNKGSEASKVYNWEGALVYDGIVYDHIRYRLRGGNGRYLGSGKRSMKFKFNDGHHFAARDQLGERYKEKWRVLECSKMFSNRMVGNFGLVDSINGQLWRLMGIPAPHTHWFHFRVVDDVEEAADQFSGDFWGMMLAQEHYDKRFLSQHGMKKGNLYKLSDGVWGGESQARYIAPDAVDDFSDYDGIEYDLSDHQSTEWIRRRVDIDQWANFSAVKEAVRHYDFWPGANKNMVYYFAPDAQVREGKLWLLPYDHDDTWGPCWNYGFDCVSGAVYRQEEILLVEKNRLREFRDIVWQSDQLNPMIDDLMRTIGDFAQADYDRWWQGNWEDGRENYGTVEAKVEDMKRFAWYGGEWAGGAVGHGGRARYLDERSADPHIPTTPRIEFSGGSGFPVDALRFDSSEYASPDVSAFTSIEWRLAVITPPKRIIDPLKSRRQYEWDAAWAYRGVAPFEESIALPSNVAKKDDLCRVRVRHGDADGRWSHWSKPFEFTCSVATSTALAASCVISEVHYHPRPATASESRAGFSTKDFEWVEILNRDNVPVDLSGARFTKGIHFTFPDGSRLDAGQRWVIVRNVKAFGLRYGQRIPVLGEWQTGDALSDSGERIRLKSGRGNTTLCELEYDDNSPWPIEADGKGRSLELRLDALSASALDTSDFSRPKFWRMSAVPDGTPAN